MDPRLNPNLSPKPQPVMSDIKLPTYGQTPQPVPTAPAPAISHNVLNAELVDAIPMRIPEAPTPATTQIATPATPQQQMNNNSDDELDQILQAVNNRVKEPAKPAPNPKKELLNKTISKAKPKIKAPKSIGVAAVVCTVMLLLVGVAIYSYKQGSQSAVAAKTPSKVGTSYKASGAIQAAGGKLVYPADLDDYSQILQDKINGLNDSQDFDTNSLSDSVLGL